MASEIRGVIFDLGGVLIDWDPRYLYRQFFGEDREAMERFLTEVWTPEWNAGLDVGRTFAEAIPDLLATHPHEAERINAYRDRWIETIRGPIDAAVTLLDGLHAAGVPLWAITNWSAETFRLVRSQAAYGFLGHFREIFVSGELRMAKPDPAIFTHALGRIDLPATSLLFVDDNAANIATAAGLGLHTHLFDDPASLETILRTQRLLP